MNDFAIRVENLGKFYRIGAQQERYRTLRESLVGAINGSLQRLRRSKSKIQNPNPNFIWALKDVSFEVKQGEVIGIIGRNGAGKSTLLKILSHITEPTEGRVTLRGRVGSLLEVGTGFHPELTGRENVILNGVILGMKKAEIERKFDEIVDFSEVEKFIDTPVKRYSSGMYMRLAFAVAAHLELEILLVDEVLAVGDAEFQKKCLGKMGEVAKEGRTVLFVSHNMAAVSNLCKLGLWLSHGQIMESGLIQNVMAQYNRTSHKQRKDYSSGPIKYVSAIQNGEFIDISVEYNGDINISSLNFGFVISDYMGRRICGTNQKIDNVNSNQTHSRARKTTVRVSQPKLFNGTYKLSIWLGDGYVDFFIDMECLEFEILNMASPFQSTGSINESGAVYPVCDWNFF